MTRREAKRLAAHIVGQLIDSALGTGWEPGEDLGLGEEDLERVTALGILLRLEEILNRRHFRISLPARPRKFEPPGVLSFICGQAEILNRRGFSLSFSPRNFEPPRVLGFVPE